MHIAVALMQSGQRVTTIDLDHEQRTLTRYIENRRITASQDRSVLKIPEHLCIDDLSHRGTKWSDSERINALSEVLRSYQSVSDFILIDTPGNGSPLTVFAHGLADTVITPVQRQLCRSRCHLQHPTPEKTLKPSRYAETVQKAFDARRTVSKRDPDWIVVRNRISPLSSRARKKASSRRSKALANRGKFRATSGLVERVVYREFFPLGLTTFGFVCHLACGVKPNVSQPKHKLIAFSRHRATFGTKFFGEADRDGLEGIMAKHCAPMRRPIVYLTRSPT
jgi:chromosome partitioning protein